MRAKKGEYGYIRWQKVWRLIRTLLFFALPLAFFFVGLILNHGDRKSIYTIIAIVGVIPACMSLVGMIMMWMRKPMSGELHSEIVSHCGNLDMMYELYLTTHDKNLFLDAAAICGNEVAAFTSEKVKSADLKFMEDHIRRSLRSSHITANVKIFDNRKHYMERLDALAQKCAEMDTSKDYLTEAVLKAIAL